VPGTEDELLVLQQDRALVHLRLRGDRAEELGRTRLPRAFYEDDCGAIDLAFDPGFVDNGFIFVSMCISGTASGVFRLHWTGELALLGETLTEIIVSGHDEATRPRHNVGSIGFDDDGNLWALFGEKTRSSVAQRPKYRLGGVVLVQPNREPSGSGFTPLPDAPFFTSEGADPAMYAIGLRSPWRGGRDRFGRIWIGDVGSETFEEVNLLTAATQNFGWGKAQGPCQESCDGFTDPIAFWDRDEHPYVLDDPDAEPTVRAVAWVGDAYRDRGDDPYDGMLTDRMLVSDMCLGFVRLLEADEDDELVLDLHVGHRPYLTGIDQSPDGHFYVSTFGDACETASIDEDSGELLRVVRAPE
jgi:glucose/arabinose dehydrogenase